MSSHLSLRSILSLSALALLWPLTAGAAESGNTDTLVCKFASSRTTITNNGNAVIPAGSKIVVFHYPAPGVAGLPARHVLVLNSDLGPGLNATLDVSLSDDYRDCSARVAP